MKQYNENDIDRISNELFELEKDSYEINNVLKSWHREYWINLETLETHTSGELSQNSWTELAPPWVRLCNVDTALVKTDDADPEDYEECIVVTLNEKRLWEFVEDSLNFYRDNTDPEAMPPQYYQY